MNYNFELMASMMCADYGHLEHEVIELEQAGIDSFHIDIMDGRYVENFAMSLNDLRCIRKLTDKPLDVHLMVEHPIHTIHLFTRELHRGDTIYIHPEAEYHPSTTLQRIIDAGMIPGIAINPGTSVEEVRMLLRIVKKVLVMSVNPGNASQMFLPYVREKYDELLAIKDQMGVDIYWDGACGADKIKEYAPLGVKGFVLGTTLLFGKKATYAETLSRIRKMDM
ncbi:MAG: ribulose-phosphate 3-epimerase [Eubacterium sp.]|nr:ribulose-phosphate 3-epimerase [Eubacterium sp.]